LIPIEPVVCEIYIEMFSIYRRETKASDDITSNDHLSQLTKNIIVTWELKANFIVVDTRLSGYAYAVDAHFIDKIEENKYPGPKCLWVVPATFYECIL
jgi:hypothetical protein